MAAMIQMSTRVDPFEVAKDEVDAAVRKIQFMLKEWRRLLSKENTSDSQKFKDLHAEIMGELQMLTCDLNEVENSITTVEQNREKFQLSDRQLQDRRDFVARCRATHQEVKGELTGQRAQTKMEDDRKEALLSHKNKEQRAQQQRSAYQAQDFYEQEQFLQRQLVNQQEDELAELSKATQRVGQVAQTINGELQTQARMLDELNEDIDEQTQRMGFIMKGVGAVLKTSNKWQISGLIGLISLFALEVFLIFNT